MAAAQKLKLTGAEAVLYWCKEHIEAVVVAYLMALFIRCFFIEVFEIPTGSMEPTLSGNATDEDDRVVARGDRIMATKFYPGLMGIDRYDVVIFRFPLNQARVFIKRVVGLPGEQLAILHGNLYTRPAGSAGPFTIARKPLKKQEGIWLAAHWTEDRPTAPIERYLSDRGLFENFWTIPTGPGVSIDGGRLSIAGLKSDERREFATRQFVVNRERDRVDDMRIEAELETTGTDGTFHLRLQNAYGEFTLELNGSGGSLTHTPTTGPAKSRPLTNATAAPGRVRRVQLAVWDGVCRAALDGEELAQIPFIETADDASTLLNSGRMRATTASFGTRGLPFIMTDLRLQRDIHYRQRESADYSNIKDGLQNAVTIPPDRYVVLGDNTSGSHDCRGWRKFDIPLKDGRTIECESIEFKDVRPENGPFYYRVEADIHGNSYDLKPEEIASAPWPAGTSEHSRGQYGVALDSIPRDNIIGTALWVWLPKRDGRGVRLIR